MTKAAEQLLEHVMRLDPADRAELVDRVEEPFEVSGDPAYVAAWEAELRERVAEMDRGGRGADPLGAGASQARAGRRRCCRLSSTRQRPRGSKSNWLG